MQEFYTEEWLNNLLDEIQIKYGNQVIEYIQLQLKEYNIQHLNEAKEKYGEDLANWIEACYQEFIIELYGTFEYELCTTYGKELAYWLTCILNQFIKDVDDPCCDNYRIAETTNKTEMISYEQAQIKGCCGYFDQEIIHPESKRKFKIGFNYGH